MNLRAKQTFAGTAACLLLLTVFGLVVGRRSNPKTQAKPISVEVVSAQSSVSQSSIMAEGEVVPVTTTNVSILPGYDARVSNIFVNVGSQVKQGQVLATLDSFEHQYTLALADSALKSAKAHYALVLDPHRPEELEQGRLKLSVDQEAISDANDKLSLLKQGTRPQEISEAQADVDGDKARLTLATSQVQRDQSLVTQELLARSDYEQAQTDAEVAQDNLTAAEEHLNQLKVGPLSQEIAEAQADLQQALLQKKVDQQSYQILNEGSRSADVDTAAAGVQAAEVEKDHQQAVLNHQYVRSPLTGIVTKRNVNVGEIVAPSASAAPQGQPLSSDDSGMFEVADVRTVEFIASVDQRYYPDMTIGRTVNVAIDALPGETFSGTLVRRAPFIFPQRSMTTGATTYNPASALTFNVWIRMANPGMRLVPGETGFLSVASRQSGLVIPQAALQSYKLGEGLVYVISGGVAHLRRVRYTGNADGSIRVVAGLNSGEEVAVTNLSKLQDGAPVSPGSASFDVNSDSSAY